VGILPVVQSPTPPGGGGGSPGWHSITDITIQVHPSDEIDIKLVYDADDGGIGGVIDGPTIKDVKIVKLLAPAVRKEKFEIYEKEGLIDINGLPSGYYGVNILLSDGTVVSESHLIH